MIQQNYARQDLDFMKNRGFLGLSGIIQGHFKKPQTPMGLGPGV
jgi:hypothetical protein